MTEPAFIILRHVNNELTNQYWQLACRRILQYYPSARIYIIDDHSKPEYLTPISKVKGLGVDSLLACAWLAEQHITVINSELQPGKGEILPLYYYYLNRWSDSAIIIHDSVFIQSPILDKIDRNQPVQYLWSFTKPLYDHCDLEQAQLSKLNYAEELAKIYHSQLAWVGCFGAMTYITWDYIDHLAEKYNIFALLDCISNRPDRCSFERTFAVMCHHDQNTSTTHQTPVSSIFGLIHEYGKCHLNNRHFRLTYGEYTKEPPATHRKLHKPVGYANAPIVKVWSGR